MDAKPDTTSSPYPQRKHLAHLSPVERHNEPVVVFVTLTIQPRGDYLANPRFHDAFLQACSDADTWRVGYFMIMPDHVHLFCSPATLPRVDLRCWVAIFEGAGHEAARHSLAPHLCG